MGVVEDEADDEQRATIVKERRGARRSGPRSNSDDSPLVHRHLRLCQSRVNRFLIATTYTAVHFSQCSTQPRRQTRSYGREGWKSTVPFAPGFPPHHPVLSRGSCRSVRRRLITDPCSTMNRFHHLPLPPSTHPQPPARSPTIACPLARATQAMAVRRWIGKSAF